MLCFQEAEAQRDSCHRIRRSEVDSRLISCLSGTKMQAPA
jgi:hypothetical protein